MIFPLTEQNIATILIDGSVIFLLVGVLMETKIMRRRGRQDDRLFLTLVILNMVLAGFDMMTYLADQKSDPFARILNLGGITAFYIVFLLMLMVWLHYCVLRFDGDALLPAKVRRFLYLPGLITEVFVIVNLFTGWIFSVDDANVYHRNALFAPMFFVIGYFIVLCFVLVARYRRAGAKEGMIPVWIYLVPFAAGLLVPFLWEGISLTAAGLAMSILFTHLGTAAEAVNYGAKGGDAI